MRVMLPVSPALPSYPYVSVADPTVVWLKRFVRDPDSPSALAALASLYAYVRVHPGVRESLLTWRTESKFPTRSYLYVSV
jgi:hypothetical protein